MTHYIDADRLRAEINRRIKKHKELSEKPEMSDLKLELQMVDDNLQGIISFIDSLQQEQLKLTQVPRIEQETQKKGWLDYGLLISEIGLHRSNAIERIKETKERATEIKRNIAPHDLAILIEYLESAGAEIVLCCLQRYCMDFMFTQDEVKEIIQQEQLPGIEEHGVPGKDFIPVEWVDACEKYGKWKIVKQEQQEINIPSDGSGAMGIIPPKFKLDVKEQSVERLGEEFDEECHRYFNNMTPEQFLNTTNTVIARHFAEWGADHLKK